MEIGKSKDAGYMAGVRRTLPIGIDDAWRLVTSAAGVRAWLGEGSGVELEPGRDYTLKDGSTGTVRVLKPGSHLRITWLPDGWPRPSTIQVRVLRAALGTTIALHQEHLPNAAARAEALARFAAALGQLETLAAQL